MLFFTTGIFLIGILAMFTSPFLHAQWRYTEPEILAILEKRLDGYPRGTIVVGMINENGRQVLGASAPGGSNAAIDYGTAVFEIGSVTKAFTGTLLADMVVRGEVALGDSIALYLPPEASGAKGNLGGRSLLDLATHSSGLPSLPDDFNPADPENPYADYAEQDLYRFLARVPLRLPGGRAYEYSNLGAGLLGGLLARRAGMSYETLLRERILGPLGMSNTAIMLGDGMRQRLVPGNNALGLPEQNWDMGVLAGAGGLRSTADDMLRFLAAATGLATSPLDSALREARVPRRSAGTRTMSIGLGWHILGNGSIVWHNGQTGGYHSFVGFDPERRAGVVVLSSIAIDIDDIGIHLLDSGRPLQHPPRPDVPAVHALDTATLDRYVGRYQLTPAFAIEISRIGERLFAQATDQFKLRIIPVSPTEFILVDVDARLGFGTDGAGAVNHLVLYQDGHETRGERVR